MTQLRRWTTILGLALFALLTVVATAEAQARTTRPRPGYDQPDSDRSGRYSDRYDRSRGDSRVVALARELEDASRHAASVAERRNRREERAVTDSFFRFEEAARRFARSVDRNGNGARGEFDRLAARYYELRRDFSRYHGPQDVRAAFHRINAPMEEIYRTYTGRDLYRDDPHRGANGRYGQQRGYDRSDGRYEDDRGRRDERGARDTRTVIPRRRN
ncbi:MAG TPA: hypothetical protein VHQ65_16140 [Thermoanaerobaculia bacterium]|nr:hypothetical protein [Thermoanaerobaculia bacterium]